MTPIDSYFSVRDGHLRFDGADLVALADAHETPFYVYSARRVQENVATVREAFTARHPATEVFFATKACGLPWVLDLVRRAGANAEVNSGGELWKVLRAGFRPDQVVFTGVAKTVAELEQAVRAGIRAVVVDSVSELERLDAVATRLGRRQGIALRVDVRVATETHPDMRTANGGKFGIDLADAVAAFRRAAALPGVDVRGLHLHIGSQITGVEPYQEAVARALAVLGEAEAAIGRRLEFLDIGGGFPVPYMDAHGAPCAREDYFCVQTTPADHAAAVCAVLEAQRPDLTLFIEPGRYVVADAAVVVTRVQAEKVKHALDDQGRPVSADRWLLIDCGYDTLLDHTFVDWYFRIVVANRAAEPADAPFRLGGPLCDSADVYLGDGDTPYRRFPAATGVGDVLVIRDVGAYGVETMTQYNGRPRAGVLGITPDGEVVVARRAETYEDLVRLDLDPREGGR